MPIGSDVAIAWRKLKRIARLNVLRTLVGQISISNLPPHRGLIVNLAFFEVDDADSDPPYNGDPPAEAASDCPQLYKGVDLDSEYTVTERDVSFSIKHAPGYYYIQVRAILFREQNGKVFAQAEQFFFGRRPLALIENFDSVTFPIAWPSTPLGELEHYGTIRP